MAVTSNTYVVGGSGQAGPYSYSFPILADADVRVSVNGVVKTVTTHYTLDSSNTRITFVSGQEPSTGDKVIVYRNTDEDPINSTFVSGSTIRSTELNDNFSQLLYIAQESDNQSLSKLGGVMEGDVGLGLKTKLYFEGDTDNAHETTITVVDPTADRTITFPDTTGTVVTTGDTATVTATMLAANSVDSSELVDGSIDASHFSTGAVDSQAILDNTILNADVNSAAAIAGTKIHPVFGNQTIETTGHIDIADNSTIKVGTDDDLEIKFDGTNAYVKYINDTGDLRIRGDSIILQDNDHGHNYITATQDGSVDLYYDNTKTFETVNGGAKVTGNLEITGLLTLGTASIGTGEIEDNAIATAKIANSAVTTVKINNSAVDSTKLANASVVTDRIADNAVVTAKIADDNVTYDKLADNSVGSAMLLSSAVTTAKIADDNVTYDKLADNSVGSAMLMSSAVITTKIANSAVDSTKLANASVVTDRLADNSVATAKIIDNAVTTDKIADAELTTLAGMQSATASILAANTNLTATLAEINTVVDGKAPQTTISDDDTKYPTSGAVVDYVAAQLAPIGGLEVIPDEDSFFGTQPASGVVMSIANCDGIVVNSSGVCTTARTSGNGSDNVTINNFPASLRSKTLTGELGLMVSSTGTGHVYNYHKLLAKEDDVQQLSQDINDFKNRYRVGGSNPTSDNDAGDLFFNTGTGKMLVWDTTGGSAAWEEVQSIGNFFINTISSYSGTGGNSATFNGSAYRFVLSNAPTSAQQLLVSVNGVVQKPNSGASQPSEGFAIDGSSILFSSAPATGSDYFIVTIGSAVNVGTPSNNTVGTAIIQNLAVTDAKIANDTISEGKLDIHNAPSGTDKYLKYTANGMEWVTVPAGVGGALGVDFNDNVKSRWGTGNDLEIFHDGTWNYLRANSGNLAIQAKSGENSVVCEPDGKTALYHDNSEKLYTQADGVHVIGDLSVNSSSKFYGYDNTKVSLGHGNDLQFYHDGTHSYLRNDTNQFYCLAQNNFYIQHHNAGSSIENMLIARGDGAVELYYDNSKKLETTSGGVTVTGGLIKDGSSDPIVSNQPSGGNAANPGLQIKNNGTINGSWRYDGRLEIGGQDSNAEIKLDPAGHIYILNDTGKIQLGASQDLQIYHDGSNSRIHDTGTGVLVLAGSEINLNNAASTEYCLKTVENGDVGLYYDGAQKFSTRSDGVKLDQGHFYADDSSEIKLGNSGDIRIYHDSSNNYWNASNGHTYILANGNNVYLRAVNNEDGVIVHANSGVDLFFNNSKKFETLNTGVHVTTNNDIRFANGSWTGDTYGKIQQHSNIMYFCGGSNGFVWKNNTTEQWIMEAGGTLRPITNNTYDLGGSSHRIRNLYTADLQMSNEGSANEVDGTWGNYTIQEGENDLFLINRRNGKKYKFNLTEVA